MSLEPAVDAVPVVEADEDEIKVEDEVQAEVEQPKWDLVNDRPPLWMRDPKEVTEEEYEVRIMLPSCTVSADLAMPRRRAST